MATLILFAFASGCAAVTAGALAWMRRLDRKGND